MNQIQEYRENLINWKEQSPHSFMRDFHVPITKEEVTGEELRYMVPPQGAASNTGAVEFSAQTDTVSGQGSLLLGEFNVPYSQTVGALDNMILIIPSDWPLQSCSLYNFVPVSLLNTLHWFEDYQHEVQEDKVRRGKLLSQEVIDFCSQHQVFGHLQSVIKLVQECFESEESIIIEKEYDPEFEDEWILVTADIRGEIGTILTQYDTYTRRFINAVPWPQRNQIRFNYNVV